MNPTVKAVLELAKWADHLVNGGPNPMGGEAAKPNIEAVIQSLVALNRQYEKTIEILATDKADLQIALQREESENALLTAEIAGTRSKLSMAIDEYRREEERANSFLYERNFLQGVISRHGIKELPVSDKPLIVTEVVISEKGE